jgi:signal peptidase I
MASPATAAASAPASAPPVAAASRDAPRPGLARAIAENVEALGIAIVMALILKYFLIEAYKIPTGSMQPGIMGDQIPGIFDRVLVNKLVYLLRDPERFEVVVFKNPLWQRQNYIKRLIGLPGERIALRNGDVFVTPPSPGGQEAIARKPDRVWRAVRKDLIPKRNGSPDLALRFERSSGEARVEEDRIVLPAGGGTASIRTREEIRDGYLDGYDPELIESYLRPASPYVGMAGIARSLLKGSQPVTDYEIAADVTPGPDATSIVFELTESGRVHRAVLPVGSGQGRVDAAIAEGFDPIEWEDPAAAVPPLERGVTTRISFRNVDDELVLALDGDVAARRRYRTRGVDPAHDPRTRAPLASRATIEASGSFTLTDLGLWRDLHYLPDGDWRGGKDSAVYVVPQDEYMVLGDNTQNSWDCRQWRTATYRLKDGRRITGNYFSQGQNPVANPDANPGVEGSNIHFRNVYGQKYVFHRTDLEDDLDAPEIVDVHSFPAEFLLGKAIAVFWPLPPFSPVWRLKWVR